MAGLAPKLPLVRDEVDGFYKLIKTYKDLIQQNLKMVVLTSPGERIMDPLFGVGIRQLLFDNAGVGIESELEARIRNQVAKYMPFLDIDLVEINSNGNLLDCKIFYTILPLDEEDLLAIALDQANID